MEPDATPQTELTKAGRTLIPGGYREIWNVAYPLIVTTASHSIMQFADRKFLSMNSTDDVAAAFPAGIVCFSMMTFFMVTVGFTSSVVSQFYGRGDRRGCVRATWAGAVVAFAAAQIAYFVLPTLGALFIRHGGHPPSIMMREVAYFDYLMPFAGYVFLSTAFCSFFSGRGKTWYVAAVHFFSCCVNIVLDYAMIFGRFGSPKLGIVGAGLATSISSGLGMLLIFAVFLLVKQKDYQTRAVGRPLLLVQDIRRLVSYGVPSGIQVTMSVSAFSLIVFLIGRLGGEEMAATTIALSINMIVFLPMIGISDAISVIVGKYIGKGELEIAEKAAYRTLKAAFLYMAVMSIGLLVAPEELCRFFSPRNAQSIDFEQVVIHGRYILFVAAGYNVFNAFRFVFLGALRGAGDTKWSMWIVIGCAWLYLVPGSYLCIRVYECSLLVIWTFISSYSLLLSFFLVWRFRTGAWKKIDLIKRSQGTEDALAMETVDLEEPTVG